MRRLAVFGVGTLSVGVLLYGCGGEVVVEPDDTPAPAFAKGQKWACELINCDTGWFDYDGAPSNGCESFGNCQPGGECTGPLDCAGQACNNGYCGPCTVDADCAAPLLCNPSGICTLSEG